MTPNADLDTLLRDGMRPDPEHVAMLMGPGSEARPDPDNPSRIIYYRYGRIVGITRKEPSTACVARTRSDCDKAGPDNPNVESRSAQPESHGRHQSGQCP